MRPKQSATLVAAILVAAFFLLILSAVGVLRGPFSAADRFTAAGQPSQPDARKPVESEDPARTEVASGDPVSTVGPTAPVAMKETGESETATGPAEKPLPLGPNDPDALPDAENALRRWPAESAVPVLCEPDLSIYPTRKDDARPLEGVTVILDPSGGGSRTGAVVRDGDRDIFEKELTLDIATEVERELTRLGARVLLTRGGDTAHSVYYVAAFAAEDMLTRYREAAAARYTVETVDQLILQMQDVMRLNTDRAGGQGLFERIGTPSALRLIYDIEAQCRDTLFIQVALNRDDDPSVRGAEIAYLTSDRLNELNNGYAVGEDPNTLPPVYTMTDDAARERLAYLIDGHLALQTPGLGASGAEGRATVARDPAVLHYVNVAAVSVRPGYLTNKDDRAILTSAEGRATIGTAVAHAVYQYFVQP